MFRYVFLEGSHDSGRLSDPEYALMKRWFDFSLDKFYKQVKPDLIGNHLIVDKKYSESKQMQF